jgi:hypothetical protein
MASARDETGDWIVPEGAVPTIGELEDRIEVAISIARSSEAAAMTLADAALESAGQARRAAELAELSALAAVSAGRSGPGSEAEAPEPAPAPAPASEAGPAPVEPELDRNGSAGPPEEWLLDFSRRADRVGARFAKLTRV